MFAGTREDDVSARGAAAAAAAAEGRRYGGGTTRVHGPGESAPGDTRARKWTGQSA